MTPPFSGVLVLAVLIADLLIFNLLYLVVAAFVGGAAAVDLHKRNKPKYICVFACIFYGLLWLPLLLAKVAMDQLEIDA